MAIDAHPPLCAECGSRQAPLSCDELFERLLALDHSRQPPWGPLHGVVVSCFFLQHPAHRLAPRGRKDAGWAFLLAYRSGGPAALEAVIHSARRRNSHRSHAGPELFHPAVPLPERPAPTSFGTTIADVAVDGSFPADGYDQRVSAWASATYAAWTGPS
ncbi:hypothetical protein Ais01nite_01370 [Asanoa ishikariensis]|uniref:Uncharacterized protein n=1 Tax=Asanoa ishikariensis TaxID=137265 RepID=A0A1H3TMW3_9ACTN|nr:DUF5946 family protein [Asanoa ishikariensis]GIF62102.1 hypothetical protein Ais01nite_01370 [Asanoa ishikariensis]SDZ51633.1 hypothetical protein SAMN05421684_6085 [Asanoa ishikariensis]